MTDPYVELDNLRRRLARIEAAAAGTDPATRIYTTREIESPEFWARHRTEILVAAREPGTPRIVQSEAADPPAPIVYPDTGIPGLVQRGQDLYESTPPQKEAKS